MRNKFHIVNLSAVLVSILAGLGGIGNASAAESHYFGRWTVSDDKPAFSTKGKLYKTFDVAMCGKDFCGISVNDKGACGETLFRFLTIHENNDEITGHGRWGTVKKKLTIGIAKPDGEPSYLFLGLGDDDMDITGREGSIPTFEANYKSAGEAQCKLGGANS